MQFALRAAAVLAGLTCIGAAQVRAATGSDRSVTKVVKMLEGMLGKSKADGDLDRKLYAKFICYCNSKKETKTKEIKDLTFTINNLGNKIAEMRGSTGEESSALAELKAQLAENVAKQAQANKIRGEENADYLATKADSETAIQQMKDALNTLAEVGADQTAALQMNTNYLRMSALQTQKQERIHRALVLAASMLEPSRAKTVEALLQAPFTGEYTSQSGEVVGILKQMRETFENNLEEATAAEEASLAQHNKLMAGLTAAHAEMTALQAEKQAIVGQNDGALATARANLADVETEKATHEDFMDQLIPMCNQKATEYEQRNVMRADEDAAISQAISILDSDEAFAAFGKTDGTTIGGTGPTVFFQRATLSSASDLRAKVQRLLRQEFRKHKSMRLVKIVALLEAGNPFTAVLEAIEKVIVLIDEEGLADKDNLDWCNSERTANDAQAESLNTVITELTASTAAITAEIEDAGTGLKDMIAATETSLKDNYNAQQTQTEQRTEENNAYVADAQALADAQSLLTAAINVLTKYYEKIPTETVAPQASVTMAGDSDAVPETHEGGGHRGQSDTGNKVIEMLTYIRDNTHKEETAAHQAEHDSQHGYEDSMATLKSEEATLSSSLASLKETLAEKEKQLFEQTKELKANGANLVSVQGYLASIKSNCDFITENIQFRDQRRASEKGALEGAIDLIKGTPVYKTAIANAHLESLGECKDICVEAGEEHVKCKACLAKVEIPGYCAGHPDTQGC